MKSNDATNSTIFNAFFWHYFNNIWLESILQLSNFKILGSPKVFEGVEFIYTFKNVISLPFGFRMKGQHQWIEFMEFSIMMEH